MRFIKRAALLVMVVCGAYLIWCGLNYNKSNQAYEVIQELALTESQPNTEPSSEMTTLCPPMEVDHDSLKNINQNYIGWLYACNGKISYPIVKSADNEDYLYHDFKGNKNIAGAIFADYRCNPIDGFMTMLYGHSMKDGSMFRRLIDYKSQDYYNDNPYFYIYTPSGNIRYKIFSVYITDPDEGELYFGDYPSSEKEEIINKIIERSLYPIGGEVPTDKKIVALATCDVVGGDRRVVVNGVSE